MTLGLKDLYYAVCTEADGAESYGTPKKMAEDVYKRQGQAFL